MKRTEKESFELFSEPMQPVAETVRALAGARGGTAGCRAGRAARRRQRRARRASPGRDARLRGRLNQSGYGMSRINFIHPQMVGIDFRRSFFFFDGLRIFSINDQIVYTGVEKSLFEKIIRKEKRHGLLESRSIKKTQRRGMNRRKKQRFHLLACGCRFPCWSVGS